MVRWLVPLGGVAFVVGIWLAFKLNDLSIYIAPTDMALCPDWVPLEDSAEAAGEWSVDIDG